MDPASSTIAWRATPTLWGNTTWPSESTTYTPLRFPGQYFDPETRLHYNVHRYYDPETARYTSPDPLGLAPSPNPDGYVTTRSPKPIDNPEQIARLDIRRTDRLGGLLHEYQHVA
ncbi:RHS repeat-associated protein [Kitasatospora sp. GP82]|nr:RHS repeat-associated protein [Kitasatospora sp. GP82]